MKLLKCYRARFIVICGDTLFAYCGTVYNVSWDGHGMRIIVVGWSRDGKKCCGNGEGTGTHFSKYCPHVISLAVVDAGMCWTFFLKYVLKK